MRQIALEELAELYQVADSDGNLKIEYDLMNGGLRSLGLDPVGPGEEMQRSIVRYALHIRAPHNRSTIPVWRLTAPSRS